MLHCMTHKGLTSIFQRILFLKVFEERVLFRLKKQLWSISFRISKDDRRNALHCSKLFSFEFIDIIFNEQVSRSSIFVNILLYILVLLILIFLNAGTIYMTLCELWEMLTVYCQTDFVHITCFIIKLWTNIWFRFLISISV